MKFCPECGEKTQEGIKFCGSCGGSLQAGGSVGTTVSDLASSPQVAAATDKAKGIFNLALTFLKHPEDAVKDDFDKGNVANGLIFTGITAVAVILLQLSMIRAIIESTRGVGGGLFADMLSVGRDAVLPAGTIISVNLVVAAIAIVGFWVTGIIFSSIAKSGINSRQVLVLMGYATIPYALLILIATALMFLGGIGMFLGYMTATSAILVFFVAYYALLERKAPKISVGAGSVFAVLFAITQIIVGFILMISITAAMAANAAQGMQNWLGF